MTQLRQVQIVVPVADSGFESPLPPLTTGSGTVVLPWPRPATDLSCARSRTVPALVLENELVRVTVLTGLGGRLHSLWHKEDERELSANLPVFSPAGGSLVYAATVDGPGGDPVLRLWEWDQVLDLPYQVDFWLPAGSDRLHVGTRVRAGDPRPGWWRFADDEPAELLCAGSGWGALELFRMKTSLRPTPFSCLGFEQQPWLDLLAGNMPAGDPNSAPGRSLVGRHWRYLLEHAPENWLSAYHLGTARWFARDLEGAVAAWRRSIELAVSPWAIRNLAVAEYHRGHVVEAAELLTAAAWSAPQVPQLCEEARGLLLVTGQPAEADALRQVQTRP
ncbi:hypothetical protein GCM10010174_37080 [Kutzneria viridogrisea]|uniref:Tetratricopeptide repeat protein n=1 Tax=Kutzneria viridogrisea TaxID=47990 RepID=A0ABR6BU16_9PSEU|nr:hypothetical protein [Kutzneria viridogrisea]